MNHSSKYSRCFVKAALALVIVLFSFIVWRTTMSRESLDRALIEAVKRTDDITVQSLLERGANANARDQSSWWYRVTVRYHREEPVKLPYPTALSVLVYSCFENDLHGQKPLNIARCLLAHGASLEEHYRDGDTPLMVATWAKRKDLVHLFVERGADVNSCNDFGVTALMQAASSGDVDTLRFLAKHGADLNARDKNGCTPIRHSIWTAQDPTLTAIIDLGADVNLKDNNGASPLTIARQEKRREVVEILQAAGAKP